MKKSSILWIILSVIALILLVDILFHLIYFNNIHKNTRFASESEKQKAIGILNQSLNLTDYQIKVSNIYTLKNKEFVQIELVKGKSKRHYTIDLEENKVIRK